MKIRRIERSAYVGPVHNLSVEEDESYSAEGIAAHNCRCRKISRSTEDLKRLGLTVSTGSDLHGLPDEGWQNQSVLLGLHAWDFSAFLLELHRNPIVDG